MSAERYIVRKSVPPGYRRLHVSGWLRLEIKMIMNLPRQKQPSFGYLGVYDSDSTALKRFSSCRTCLLFAGSLGLSDWSLLLAFFEEPPRGASKSDVNPEL